MRGGSLTLPTKPSPWSWCTDKLRRALTGKEEGNWRRKALLCNEDDEMRGDDSVERLSVADTESLTV